MDKSKSFLAAPEHRECYEGLKKSYDLDKTIISTYGKVYSLKRSRKDKDEDPSAGSTESGSSKGTKFQSKSSGKSVQSEESEFVVADKDMPQDQKENLGNDDVEPKEKALKTWFQIYGFLLKLPMINMHYKESHIKENNVEVMRKHVYGYLKDIVIRRADNDLYRFKEGNFPRLRINDNEDILLLVVQNRLTNLSDDDVSNFAIALRMFTKSLVIQKRVEDLQLGVKSYQKKINVTKPQTTISGIRKRDPYTPYQDPQGFIYVEKNRRNKLMRSDELYKFSNKTLTRL
ncbi:hypothetical protein Tco_1446582 [Tanacetum coccineum]